VPHVAVYDPYSSCTAKEKRMEVEIRANEKKTIRRLNSMPLSLVAQRAEHVKCRVATAEPDT
jgi:hypothetical protein